VPDQPNDYESAFLAYCKERQGNYHRIFGVEQPAGSILLAPAELSTTCWFGGGVYQFPPSDRLTHWHYVTEAMSQPDDPVAARASSDPGYAFELVIPRSSHAAGRLAC
jgi:hypothetical protein